MTFIENNDLPEKWREKCGVFGVVAPGADVARLTFFGLFALQHRGQESAGIAVTSAKHLTCYKEMGLVSQVFTEKILHMLKGETAVGHVRYSTTGSSTDANAQPVEARGKWTIALAHNGNLVNTASLRDKYEQNGYTFSATTDSEIIAGIIANGDTPTVADSIIAAMDQISGAYSIAVLHEDSIYAFRDPHGIRPLCIGRLDSSGWVVSSETCGLDIVGAEYVREVDPGELVRLHPGGMETIHRKEARRKATCVFEFIYFARPDSKILETRLYGARERMGHILAREAPAEADVVISVPDSGTPAAIGFAKESGIPFQEGLIKNRYVGRTFIQPEQRIRAQGIRMKLNPLREVIDGKRVVIVDDSIVRGTTSTKIIQLLRDAGAKEIHMRVSSPPVAFTCHYGIDTASSHELIASQRSVDEIRGIIGLDSLEYLSIEGLVKATGMAGESLCMACFNNDYPIPLPKQLDLAKMVLEKPKI